MSMPGRSCELSIGARTKKGKSTMKRYEFTIVASGLDPQADDFESQFYEAGCDDATIAFQKGHVIVDFSREAESIDAAISSAVAAVLLTGATIDRVEPDPLVSLSEIAARTGMSRAAMTQYSKGQRSRNFPAPVAKVTSDSPLWDWASVARWLFSQRKLSREEAIAAEVVKEANRAIASGEPHLGTRLRKHADKYEAAL